ncbi:hypothetical protein J6590_017565 [Homalodisca vitripennis]|nr:hypothetical protein J6590_017565 [Homalodisca vitripennis]
MILERLMLNDLTAETNNRIAKRIYTDLSLHASAHLYVSLTNGRTYVVTSRLQRYVRRQLDTAHTIAMAVTLLIINTRHIPRFSWSGLLFCSHLPTTRTATVLGYYALPIFSQTHQSPPTGEMKKRQIEVDNPKINSQRLQINYTNNPISMNNFTNRNKLYKCLVKMKIMNSGDGKLQDGKTSGNSLFSDQRGMVLNHNNVYLGA